MDEDLVVRDHLCLSRRIMLKSGVGAVGGGQQRDHLSVLLYRSVRVSATSRRAIARVPFSSICRPPSRANFQQLGS